MRVLRWIGIGIAAIAALLVLVGVVARFSDGPIGPFAGGPLRSGERVSDPNPDWSFAAPIREIELELVNPPRSRTTWILVHEGRPYVPCGFTNIRLWKQWPYEAMEDGRAVLRIGGRRYEHQAVRVTDPREYEELVAAVRRKYGVGPVGPSDAANVWFFRMDPRPSH